MKSVKWPGRVQSRTGISYFSELAYSSEPGATAADSQSSKPLYMPQREDKVAARAARILKAGRPPRWSTSDRMSGVFTKRLPRKYSTMGGVVSSRKYCVSSSFELRQVK